MTRARPGRFPTRTDGLYYLNFRTTTRDRWILAMLYEHQVLTTEQVAALAFGTVRSASRRLAALTDLSLTDRTRANRTSAGPNSYLYTLGPAGALLLGAERGLSVKELRYDRARAQRQVMRPDLPHTLGCNTLMTLLAAAHRTGDAGRLRAWLGPLSCLRRWGDLIRPDGYGHWSDPTGAGPGGGCGFFLEYDTGTESVTQLAGKVRGYLRFAENHVGHHPILIRTSHAAREARLHQVLTETHDGICPVPIATATSPHPAAPVWLPHGATTRTGISALPQHFTACGYRMLPPPEIEPVHPEPAYDQRDGESDGAGP